MYLFCLIKLFRILIGCFAHFFGEGKWIALGVQRLLSLMFVFHYFSRYGYSPHSFLECCCHDEANVVYSDLIWIAVGCLGGDI